MPILSFRHMLSIPDAGHQGAHAGHGIAKVDLYVPKVNLYISNVDLHAAKLDLHAPKTYAISILPDALLLVSFPGYPVSTVSHSMRPDRCGY